jgi:hypothetical protein
VNVAPAAEAAGALSKSLKLLDFYGRAGGLEGSLGLLGVGL